MSVSGGKDSAALAIYVQQTRNIPDIEYVFMDTEQELVETYDFLDRLEGVLGQSITRLKPERSFEELLKLNNNYLPSANARWCTVSLKIKPFEVYVGSDIVYSYIGIRADENRKGFISSNNNIKPIYPFIEDGITKQDVHRILEESGLGLPEYYRWRSRSGCYFCFFQRMIEWVGLYENHPDLFEKARRFETVDESSGTLFTWTGTGPLENIIKDKERIKRAFDIERNKRKKLKKARLIDVMREYDPFEDADIFDQIMKEQDGGEGCLVCHL